MARDVHVSAHNYPILCLTRISHRTRGRLYPVLEMVKCSGLKDMRVFFAEIIFNGYLC